MPAFTLRNAAGQASPEVAIVTNCDAPRWVLIDVVTAVRAAEDPVNSIPYLRFTPAYSAARTVSMSDDLSSRINSLEFLIDLEQGSPIYLPVPGSLSAGIAAMANSVTVRFEAISFDAKESDQPRKPLKRTQLIRAGATSGTLAIPRGATHVTVVGLAAMGAVRSTASNCGEQVPIDLVPGVRTPIPGCSALTLAPVTNDLFLVWEVCLS